MVVKINKNILRNAFAYFVEKVDKQDSLTQYCKRELSYILNNTENSKNTIIEVDQEVIDKLCKWVEFNAVYDKLGRYGDFYYKLKRL
jgi:hypothetical protein